MNDDFHMDMLNGVYDPQRERVEVTVGSLVLHEKTIYRIDQVLGFESIIATAVESGRSSQLRIADLRPISALDPNRVDEPDIAMIADEDWQIAQHRFSIIEPFVSGGIARRDDVIAGAEKHGVNAATIYRWLKLYQARSVVTDLIPKKRGWAAGKTRLSREVNQILEQAIDSIFLTTNRHTPQMVVLEVNRLCHEKGYEPPSSETVRQRIHSIPEKIRLRKRGYRELAKNKFIPVPGKFPNADYPLAVVQIDHTPADIILVDDLHRKPIGRPWITLSMDVYSRMVTGYYLSFEAPSVTSVGLCIAHACLPKDSWLAMHQINAEWPVWGFPTTIHVDNGSDFRSSNFEKSCMQYGVNLEFRPVKVPRFGGHIERILGTFLKEIHELPGTTYSSIKDKADHNPEKDASMTLGEFEAWFATQITKVYHQRLHSTIGMTPLKQWDIGVFGNAEVTGAGLPPRPADPMSVLLDFLPAYERTVQPIGVTIDDRTYYAEALRPWIGAKVKNTNVKRKFVFRRDPRDISSIWFFDPEIKQYFKVPFADQSLPSMSLWEYQRLREKLKKEGKASVNEAQLLTAITEQRNKVAESRANTKAARRNAQRRKEHEKKATSGQSNLTAASQIDAPAVDRNMGLLDEITPDFGAVN